jgi:hypothetical protein
MRQGQPHCSQLQQAGSLRIEHAPRNINVRDCVAVQQKIASLEVVKKRKQRHQDSHPGHTGRAAVANGGCPHAAHCASAAKAAIDFCGIYGAAEAAPFKTKSKSEFFLP